MLDIVRCQVSENLRTLILSIGQVQGREAIIGIEGARQKQAPLVGGFSSAGPFTWGPWFYYQMILFTVIFPTFYSPWIYMGIAYLLTILILFKIGVELKDKNLGLILALLGTFSPDLIIGVMHLTFPNLLLCGYQKYVAV